jgi:hypothetical protein
MEPNSIAVDEKEYEQWLAQNNLSDPLPKTEQQDNQVPAYTPSEVDPNLLNPPGRDLPTALVGASPYIAGAGVTGLGIKYLRDIAKGRALPSTPSTPAPTGPVIPPNAGPQLPAANTAEGIKQIVRGAPVQPGTNPYAQAGGRPMPAPAASSAGSNLGVMSRLAQGAGTLFNNATPAMTLAAPYMMAGYEQDKIRANPSALGLESNPYAQMVRGEAATQGQAGAANRRQAIAGQQYGGLTADQQAMLEQDRITQAIRRKAAEKVLGPIAPSGY